jgi:lysophospholipid acyltransferase (LPLAT)-like uncharacterized protein
MSGWWKSARVRRLRSRLSDVQRLLYPLVNAFIRAWVAVLHRRGRFEEHGPLFDYIREGRPCIITAWHQDVFLTMFSLFRHTERGWPLLFMVGHNRVGTLGAYMLQRFGIDCVAGSRRERGTAAVEELARRAVAENKSVIIMADGSRGPSHEARWGSLHLAAISGLPLLAVRSWGDKITVLDSTWMKLALPHLSGRVVTVSAEPIVVPGHARDSKALAPSRQQLQQRLDLLAEEAEKLVGV